MKKLLSISYFFLLLHFAYAQLSPNSLQEQKEIIAVLSGHSPMENGMLVGNRSTREERQITREYLSSLISSIGLEPIIQEYRMPNVNPLVDLLFEPFNGANVYTTLPSTIPSDKYIVIGGHFDTERNCPGAIDNATGMVICYSALKKLVELNERKVNVILVFFDQEEEDLVGSQAFAQKLKEENYNILSVHTMDTMGWDGDNDRAVELELPTDYLKSIYSSAGERLGIPIHSTHVKSTDHHSFRELGFNATGLTDELVNGDYAPYKDTPKDKYVTVNFNYVASCTELVFEVLKELVQ